MVVYPRWRGELEPCQNGASFVPGLSPLARGTPNSFPASAVNSRFIPAGAGNSAILPLTLAYLTVYPRWRGELLLIRFRNGFSLGLPPLARGTLRAPARESRDDRFIPAGAGNSKGNFKQKKVTTVYPRWRGELATDQDGNERTYGLSPLARGTL